MKSRPKQMRTIAGVNIQWPWSDLIVSGTKTIETRSYRLPSKHLNQPLALIETPGPRGRRAGISSARITAVIRFAESYQYESQAHWENEFKLHRVPLDDPQFKYTSRKPRWAWKLQVLCTYDPPEPAPKKKGIVFASKCVVPYWDN